MVTRRCAAWSSRGSTFERKALAVVENLDQYAASPLTPSAFHPPRGFEIADHRRHCSTVTSKQGSKLYCGHVGEMSSSARAVTYRFERRLTVQLRSAHR